MAALDPDLLLRAYSVGVFPMASTRDAADVFWVEPKKRGVLPLDGFHLSRSLAKTIRSDRYRVTVDTAFSAVVSRCAESTDRRTDTWINPDIEVAYAELHRRGYAHSVEAWSGDDLVGGLYGVRLGAAFFGESMFSRARDSSKVALAHLVARLRVGGFRLLDCQFVTDHLASLGTMEVEREAYVALLDDALGLGSASGGGLTGAAADFFALDRAPAAGVGPLATTVAGPVSGCRIVQLLGQTS
jgi:leucyl/phenylalanyl-tRNA---protein transferase